MATYFNTRFQMPAPTFEPRLTLDPWSKRYAETLGTNLDTMDYSGNPDALFAGIDPARRAQLLNEALFRRERKVSGMAQAADSARRLQALQAIQRDPAALARVYSGEPRSPMEDLGQDTIQNYEDAGNRGFTAGWLSDRQNLVDAQRNAALRRQIRDQDLAYQQRIQSMQQQQAEQKRREEALALQQEREDRIQQTGEDRSRRQVLQNAINDVANGAVSPEDAHFFYPELTPQELGIVRSYGKQAQQDKSNQYQDVVAQAGAYNSRLREIQKQQDDLALRKWQTEQPGFLGRTFLGRTGTEQSPRELSKSESDLIARVEKDSRGSLVYDPDTKQFVPARGLAPSGFQRPPSSMPGPAIPNRAIIAPNQYRAPIGPQPPVNPLVTAFSTMSNALNPPAPVVRPTIRPQFSPTISGDYGYDTGYSGGGISRRPVTGDQLLDDLNSRLTYNIRSQLTPGQVKIGPNGQRYVYRGNWFEPL